jgi:hypothetical protein
MLLLAMQLATAAYACPAVALPAMPGCDANMPGLMDPEQPQLCQAHCQQGSQTVQPTPADAAPPAPLLLAVLNWAEVALLPSLPARRRPMLASGASPPGAPPLYLCLLVLRN